MEIRTKAFKVSREPLEKIKEHKKVYSLLPEQPLKEATTPKSRVKSIEEEIKPRAKGGPVKKGKKYIVGEKGPEVFIPKKAGRIVPNRKPTKKAK